jgi:hypothetical protein
MSDQPVQLVRFGVILHESQTDDEEEGFKITLSNIVWFSAT